MDVALPKLIAHRGAPLAAPENTLASLRIAQALGAKWVEFDVQLTRDQQVIVFHDAKLNRTSNGRGLIGHTDFNDIAHLDAGGWFNQAFKGEPIPTLAAYLQCAAQLNIGLNIELKATFAQSHMLANRVVAALDRWSGGLPAVLISSALPACLQAVSALTKRYPQGYIMHRWHDDWCALVKQLHCVSLHVNHTQLNHNRCVAIKSADSKLLAYTINDVATAESLFAMGVDAIFSDDPQLLQAPKISSFK